MSKFAVLGDPIAHSLSPYIHQHFAKAHDLDLEYTKQRVVASTLAQALSAFRAYGGMGCNLTSPLKEEALSVIETLSPQAKAAGAINTLVWRKAWHGHNTDGLGWLNDMSLRGYRLSGMHILLLGAGGAAKGLYSALQNQDIAQIDCLNRSLERAQKLLYGAKIPGHAYDHSSIKPKAYDMVIHCTSHFDAEIYEPLSSLFKHTIAYDLMYQQAAHTPFLGFASQHTTKLMDGMGMLIEQAAFAFECFTGILPRTQKLRKELGAD